MICKKCGSELPDDGEIVYCIACGAEIESDSEPVGAVSEPEVAHHPVQHAPDVAYQALANRAAANQALAAANQAQAAASQAPAAAKRGRKRGAIIAIVVAVVVVCAGVGIGVWWKMDQDAKAAAAQAEWERAHMMLDTSITSLDAPGFDEGATAIPVQVKGTDLDGNQVDELQFLHPSSPQVQTKQGSYDLTFPGGYFTSDGRAVKAPGTTVHVEPAIDKATSGDSSTSASSSSAEKTVASSRNVDEPIAFTPIEPLDATDEDIEEIAKWGAQDPDDAGKASQLKSAVITKREEAIAEKKRQEEEAAERARVEARKAEIAQTAEDFLYFLFDNNGARGKAIRERRGNVTSFTNGRKSLQSGWPYTWMASMNSLQAIDENTVAYDLDYERATMGRNPERLSDHDSGTISFGENGLIDQWYPEKTPNGRLI